MLESFLVYLLVVRDCVWNIGVWLVGLLQTEEKKDVIIDWKDFKLDDIAVISNDDIDQPIQIVRTSPDIGGDVIDSEVKNEGPLRIRTPVIKMPNWNRNIQKESPNESFRINIGLNPVSDDHMNETREFLSRFDDIVKFEMNKYSGNKK